MKISVLESTASTVEAIRKANAIRKDVTVNGTVHYSFPNSGGDSAEYNGMWKVVKEEEEFVIPVQLYMANAVFCGAYRAHYTTDEMRIAIPASAKAYGYVFLYLEVSKDAMKLYVESTPIYVTTLQNNLKSEFVLLGMYNYKSDELFQVQYGVIRLNRFWDTGLIR